MAKPKERGMRMGTAFPSGVRIKSPRDPFGRGDEKKAYLTVMPNSIR